MRDRLTGGDRMTHHGTQKRGHVRFAIDEVGILYHFLRPELVTDGIGSDDRADRQAALGDQNLGALRNRGGLGLRRGGAGEHAPGSQSRTDRDDQRSYQQNKLLLVHGARGPLNWSMRYGFDRIEPKWLK